MSAAKEPRDGVQVVVRNRKARHDYQIVDTIEAGIELVGAEVKSIRAGKLNLSDSYAVVEDDQVYLKNLHITPYAMATSEPPDPDRDRRLLLHKREIYKLKSKTHQQGLTLIPLTVYIKGSRVKIELALAAGRKKYDKRQAIAKAEADRRMKQATRRDMD
jgi:SsrA-binding protein